MREVGVLAVPVTMPTFAREDFGFTPRLKSGAWGERILDGGISLAAGVACTTEVGFALNLVSPSFEVVGLSERLVRLPDPTTLLPRCFLAGVAGFLEG